MDNKRFKRVNIIRVDIDGIICTNTYGEYEKAKPYKENIDKINKLYNNNKIILWTARGTLLDDRREEIKEITKKQLKEWKVKYHKLEFGKPYYDFIIDDRILNINDL